MARKDEEKKRRRKHRLEKKHDRQKARAVLANVRNVLEQYADLGDPGSFPGACDETLARPDLVKADLMAFAVDRYPGKAKFDLLVAGLRRGPLYGLPDLDH